MTEMTPTEIDALMNNQRIGRLSMADSNGRPYTIPMPFCWMDGTIYLRLPMTGRKGSILQTNDQVCFEVDTYTDSFDSYASVIIEGRLQPVGSVEEKRHVKLATDDKYVRLRGGFRPGHGRSKPPEVLPLQKIEVHQLAGRKKEPSESPITSPDSAIS